MIGKRQPARILHALGKRPLPIHGSQNVFRFADVSVRSLGTVELFLGALDRVPNIPVVIDVVP